ncbi:MAG: TetR/AcrR family transcriptional regulator [Acidimicrobiia bacterium]
MPRLWDDTIEEHRRSVREATLDTAAALVAERGVRAVTMSEIAQKTGIGRATLYKYFPDVESILAAWHQRQISQHLAQLNQVRDSPGTPIQRLEAVLTAYAHIQRQRTRHHQHHPHGRELSVLLHSDDQVAKAQHELHNIVKDLVEQAALAGAIRDDISTIELTGYCIHALEAAGHAPSDKAVTRLVSLTLAGMRAEP